MKIIKTLKYLKCKRKHITAKTGNTKIQYYRILDLSGNVRLQQTAKWKHNIINYTLFMMKIS